MLCAEKRISFKDFATELLLKAIEEYEDKRLANKARKRMQEADKKDNIPFDDACGLVGWDKRHLNIK